MIAVANPERVYPKRIPTKTQQVYPSCLEFMARESSKMDAVQKFNRALNKLIKAKSDSLNPDSEVYIQSLLAELAKEIAEIRSLDEQNLWKRIYVLRDIAKIRVEVFNRLMSMGGM